MHTCGNVWHVLLHCAAWASIKNNMRININIAISIIASMHTLHCFPLHYMSFHSTTLYRTAFHDIALHCFAYISYHPLSAGGDHSRGRKCRESFCSKFMIHDISWVHESCICRLASWLSEGPLLENIFAFFCLAAAIWNGWFSFAMAWPFVRLAEGERIFSQAHWKFSKGVIKPLTICNWQDLPTF